MKDWRTTLCGILAIAVQAATAFPAIAHYVPMATAFLTALGLYHARDKGA